MNPCKTSRKHGQQSGFAIILVMVFLVLAGGIAATMMARQDNETVWSPIKGTQDQIASIQDALIDYQRRNNALPMPALRTVATNSVNPDLNPRLHVSATEYLAAYNTPPGGGPKGGDESGKGEEPGLAAQLPPEVTEGIEDGKTVVMSPRLGGLAYVTNTPSNPAKPEEMVLVGAIPTETLGLPRAAAEDQFGRLLTYAVTLASTEPGKLNQPGKIRLQNADNAVVAENLSFLVISHGKSGAGAWNAKSRFKGRECAGQMNQSQPGNGLLENGDGGTSVSDFSNCSELSATFITNDVNLVAGNQKFDDQLLKGETDSAAASSGKPCTNQNVSWTDGNKALGAPVCHGTVSGLFNFTGNVSPTSQLVADTIAPTTGEATFRCNNGTVELDPSAQAPTCTATNPPGTCALPWGGTINEGQSVTAWDHDTIECVFDIVCSSEVRTCTGGVLSGTYPHQNCVKNCPANCALPWGGTINEGESVMTYAAPTYNCGDPVPESELAICAPMNPDDDTVHLISMYNYQYPSTVSVPNPCPTVATCALPWGGTINEGESVMTYAAPTYNCGDPVPESELAICAPMNPDDDTVHLISMYNYQYPSTVSVPNPCPPPPANSCALPWGGTIADGQSVNAFQWLDCESKAACNSEKRICNNGVLSGSYTQQTGCQDHCTNKQCQLPWGDWITHGDHALAFPIIECYDPFGMAGEKDSCEGSIRVCNNGVLEGDKNAVVQNCYDNCLQPGACALPWGGTIAEGSTVTAYKSNSCKPDEIVGDAGSCNCCEAETRTCQAGEWKSDTCDGMVGTCPAVPFSAGFTAEACPFIDPKKAGSQPQICVGSLPCNHPWSPVKMAHGESVAAYEYSNPTCLQSCNVELRTCNNGVLSGSFTHASCTPLQDCDD